MHYPHIRGFSLWLYIKFSLYEQVMKNIIIFPFAK